ncbi:hypothetical protein VPH35_032038 [Triticum aestivum]
MSSALATRSYPIVGPRVAHGFGEIPWASRTGSLLFGYGLYTSARGAGLSFPLAAASDYTLIPLPPLTGQVCTLQAAAPRVDGTSTTLRIRGLWSS